MWSCASPVTNFKQKKNVSGSKNQTKTHLSLLRHDKINPVNFTTSLRRTFTSTKNRYKLIKTCPKSKKAQSKRDKRLKGEVTAERLPKVVTEAECAAATARHIARACVKEREIYGVQLFSYQRLLPRESAAMSGVPGVSVAPLYRGFHFSLIRGCRPRAYTYIPLVILVPCALPLNRLNRILPRSLLRTNVSWLLVGRPALHVTRTSCCHWSPGNARAALFSQSEMRAGL